MDRTEARETMVTILLGTYCYSDDRRLQGTKVEEEYEDTPASSSATVLRKAEPGTRGYEGWRLSR